MADDSQLTRRRLLELGAGGATAAALLGLPRPSPAASPRLNVVLIVIDSLRADHVGAYGGRARTPNIDALARQGLRFTNAYPEAMATVPARRSLMTGRRVFPFRGWRRGADGMPGWNVPGWQGIDDLDSTFTTALRRAGYWTAYVTDNPHVAHARAFKGLRRSFDRFAGVRGQAGHAPAPARVSEADLRHWLARDMRTRDLRYRVRNYISHGHYWRDERRSFAARVSRAGADALTEAARHQPFCLVLDSFDPHEPWTPPRRYIDLYGDRRWRGDEPGTAPYARVSSWVRDKRLIQRMRDLYAAEVTMTDRWLGTFLHRIGELGLTENTVIALISDHGILLGEHGWTGKTAYALHPPLIHVPMLLVAPDRAGAGQTSSFFASTHDVAPTLLAMAGVRRPRGMNGADLSPLLRGGREPRRELAWGGYGNWFFARTRRWALTGDNRLRRRRLYDVSRDPRERRDLARRHPKVVRELTRRYVEQAGRRLPFYG